MGRKGGHAFLVTVAVEGDDAAGGVLRVVYGRKAELLEDVLEVVVFGKAGV